MATWGEERASLFVDGMLIDQHAYEGQLLVNPDTPVHIGSHGAGAGGSFNDLQFYNRPLRDGEIATLTMGCQLRAGVNRLTGSAVGALTAEHTGLLSVAHSQAPCRCRVPATGARLSNEGYDKSSVGTG